MKFKRKNITRKIIIALALILLMGCSVSFGVGYSKQITAWFYNIQIKINGNAIKLSKQPFIYDGAVYVPLRDISNGLGMEASWDDNTKTVKLTSNGSFYNPSNYNYPYVIVNKNDSENIEDTLNRDYDEYTEGNDDLEFKYNIDEKSRYIEVEMKGQNFEKYSSDWKKRDEDDFEDFIEDIAELVADELDEDVKIYVYDEDDKNVGKYEYDESDDKLDVEYEYGKEEDLDDVEKKLDDDYDEYTKGDDDLEFSYDIREYKDYIKVEMNGKNFDKTSSKWDDRDEGDFRDFVEEIAKEVNDVEDDIDIKIYVEDEDGDTVARYEYDESRDDFDVKYEYN